MGASRGNGSFCIPPRRRSYRAMLKPPPQFPDPSARWLPCSKPRRGLSVLPWLLRLLWCVTPHDIFWTRPWIGRLRRLACWPPRPRSRPLVHLFPHVLRVALGAFRVNLAGGPTLRSRTELASLDPPSLGRRVLSHCRSSVELQKKS